MRRSRNICLRRLAGQEDEAAVRRLCGPDVRVSQNNGRPMSPETLLRFKVAVGQAAKDF
jgi:hypothetical protein